ncbi:MAG: hypothetical protein ACFN26_09465, partial [Kingella denitrificans]
MIQRWLALTYYLYALRLAALSHFYFNPLYKVIAPFQHPQPQKAACTLFLQPYERNPYAKISRFHAPFAGRRHGRRAVLD